MINNKGLEPDIDVEMSNADWRKVQLQRLRRENPGAYKNDKQDDEVVDGQLGRAVDLLKSLLIFKERQ
jgi:hypothetical protein